MSRYISAALAVSATIVSVVAQDATKSQFPATPLASKHFSYPSGIVCRFHNVSQALATNFDLPSLTKPTPMTSAWHPVRLQSVQLYYRGPGLPLPDVLPQPY